MTRPGLACVMRLHTGAYIMLTCELSCAVLSWRPYVDPVDQINQYSHVFASLSATNIDEDVHFTPKNNLHTTLHLRKTQQKTC
ncbi:hypothetical protein GDO81_004095 [Engystomops pustulosus]|uniref:Secreted protein n=1 Tax=Engystomops pustulosus TaxID=76066 RepID=A0AAV6ZVY9_ENGPU|nr:hypothetical protein GDO81_004095 [Engystomops pustulosus]